MNTAHKMSAKAGIQNPRNSLKRLDSRFHGNGRKVNLQTFYDLIKNSFEILGKKHLDHLQINTNVFNIFTCHCEPEGRGNLVFPGIASLLCSSQG